jgi:hypothetical protein
MATVADPTTQTRSITIPKGCKPSKACSTDRTRSILCHAYLRRHDEVLYLCMTDSYVAVALRVDGDAEEGYVPIGALRLMEAGKVAEQVSETAWRVITNEGLLTFDCGEMGKFPDFASLGVWDKPDKGAVDAIGMNTSLMHKIGQALGARGGCRMQFIAPLRPIYVTPLGFDVGVALQMPIRIEV